MADIFDGLGSSVEKLGKTFFFGKKAAFVRAKKLLEQASCSYGDMEEKNAELQKTVDDNKIKLENFKLVSDALGADSPKNNFLAEFHNLIEKDFEDFCDTEPNLNDAKQLKKLQHVEDEMRRITNCKELHSKSLGVVGGGFSSGKSSFLNSFLTGSKVRLAEGIRPVTAIPSYVICDDTAAVQGITYKGGCFNIPLETYQAISHEFLKSFTFNLKEIILYITVLAPMEKKYFENLCLIDTPGYNPPSSGTAAKDFKTAHEYIKDAEFLIWTVGLDSNGTIPKDDLDFLGKLDFGKNEDKPLYIVANKADTKTEDAIEDILDEFEDRLDQYDLQYAGISAYSPKTKKVYAHRKMNIYDFLAEHNKPGSRYKPLKTALDRVFSPYIEMIINDHIEKETKRKKVKRLLLKALESGHIDIDESSNALEEGLNDLMRYFQSDENLELRLNRAKGIRQKFEDCFNGFCAEMDIQRLEYVHCTQCGKQMKKNSQFCTECGVKL
jgi:GTPase SAR1 family protein